MPNASIEMTKEVQQYGMPELISARIEPSHQILKGRRLNLLIPAISRERRNFGGPATALRFLDRLSQGFQYARIIVTHENESEVDLLEWSGWTVGDREATSKNIVFLMNKSAAMTVSAQDHFIATFWSTAIYARKLIEHQRRWFSDVNQRFVYIIQEYEPGFYAASGKYALAKTTYSNTEDIIAVFNSTALAKFFVNSGLHFGERYSFEPMFHPHLLERRKKLGSCVKERTILVYGRPQVGQNGFDLIVEGLRSYIDSYEPASKWRLISAGLPHSDVSLGRGLSLNSRGTLTLDAYACELAKCWVAVSFVFNASTSYSARDMAEFGAWVVTNQFEWRKPADLPRNVITLDEPTPENMAAKLTWCCDRFDPGLVAVCPDLAPVYKREGEEFPFATELLSVWLTRKSC